MECPICTTTLEPTTLESSLRASTCPACGGHFILSSDYLDWRQQHPANLDEQPDPTPLHESTDTSGAKRCPHCRHLMFRYRVGHDIAFGVDHCGSCNSVWLDRTEWDSLKRRNLHDDINRMFTDVWQRRVRAAEHRATMHTIYQEKFGAEDYAEAQRVKAWLDAHPQRQALRAFLTAEDPYSR
ncbi:MAG: zf-TFIIB domain-containing protein [Herpetosiphonaceae bacterium]|nr:zf-TFIIB domain-containing protein [Herpetosiphonaceae bacterium]